MTQEKKELLLKDLCARLPYGVKLLCTNGEVVTLVNPPITIQNDCWNFKPYLRPMSSMTEEELHEYNMHLLGITTGVDAANFMIWVYKHHLDIFHFIEKGIALRAPEGMYEY